MIPSGYEKLATIGILYRGEYSPDEQYKFLSAVYHSGSTYVALKDSPVGAPIGDGVNWQYMAKGFVEGVLSAVNAQDTAGVLGTAGKTVNSQTLVDAIADKVMTKLLQKNKILQTVEQVMASKDADNVTGAAATAELNRKLARTVFSTHKVIVINTIQNGDVTIPLGLANNPELLHIAANINTEILSQSTYFGGAYGNTTVTYSSGMVSGIPQTTMCVYLVDRDGKAFTATIKLLNKDSLVLTIANTSTSPYSAWLYITVY